MNQIPHSPARIDEAAEDSPQAATVRLDIEKPTHDAIEEEAAPVSFVRGFLSFILPIAAFIAVIVFTVPAWEAVQQELGTGAILSTLGIVVRLFLAVAAGRYVHRWISPRGA